MSKQYQLTTGECKACSLNAECKKNPSNIKDFLLKLGILCEKGKRLEVVND